MPDAPRDGPLLTMPTAAKLLGRSAAWVKTECDAGRLRHWVVRGRRYTTQAALTEMLDAAEGAERPRPIPVAARVDTRATRAAMERLRAMGF